ncbi:MAG: hypothetical protein V3T83_11300 [Acidobacteriota bacterium]
MVDFCQQSLKNRPVETCTAAPLQAIFQRARWIVLVIVAALAYGWIQGESLQVSYQAAQFRKENQKMHALVSALRVEHSALTAPDLIDQQARRQGFVRFDEGIEVVEGLVPLGRPGQVLMAANRTNHSSRGWK